MIELSAQPLTTAAFAPYGWLLAAHGTGRLINKGSSQRYEADGALALNEAGGTPCLALFRARAQDPAGPWQELERHALGTQSFIPLNGARCVLLVATGPSEPDPATLAAFSVAGEQAFTLAPGTWHHGLIALADGDFAVLERRADAVDCDTARLPAPVTIRLR